MSRRPRSNRPLAWLGVVLVLLMLLQPALAQAEPFRAAGVTITYPDDWTVWQVGRFGQSWAASSPDGVILASFGPFADAGTRWTTLRRAAAEIEDLYDPHVAFWRSTRARDFHGLDVVELQGVKASGPGGLLAIVWAHPTAGNGFLLLQLDDRLDELHLAAVEAIVASLEVIP